MFTDKGRLELFDRVSQERVIAPAVLIINYCCTHLGSIARGTSGILLQDSHIVSALVGYSGCLSCEVRYLQ